MYGGRLSDTEIVVRSSFIDALEEKGFGPGHEIMADKGFNPIAKHLLRLGVKLTLPPALVGGRTSSHVWTWRSAAGLQTCAFTWSER